MFIYRIVALVIFGAVTSASSTVMKMQVNDRVPEDERFSWSRNYADVGRKYRQLFPDSLLPDIARCSGWICLLLLATGVRNSFFEK
jgi:hypothetical protein